LIERNPSPAGGFFAGWFPNQEPGGEGSPLKNNLQFDLFWGLFFRGVLFLMVWCCLTTHLSHALEDEADKAEQAIQTLKNSLQQRSINATQHADKANAIIVSALQVTAQKIIQSWHNRIPRQKCPKRASDTKKTARQRSLLVR